MPIVWPRLWKVNEEEGRELDDRGREMSQMKAWPAQAQP